MTCLRVMRKMRGGDCVRKRLPCHSSTDVFFLLFFMLAHSSISRLVFFLYVIYVLFVLEMFKTSEAFSNHETFTSTYS